MVVAQQFRSILNVKCCKMQNFTFSELHFCLIPCNQRSWGAARTKLQVPAFRLACSQTGSKAAEGHEAQGSGTTLTL